jgi:hypothetical protein
MSIEFQQGADVRILTCRLTGTLTAEDYARFVPEVERMIQAHGKIRLMVEMRDFHGWNLGALWEDTKFAVKHFADVERCAFVGERKWQEWMSTFFRPFTAAEIRYFPSEKVDDAVNWLMQH